MEERGDLGLNVFWAGRQAGLKEPAANVPPVVRIYSIARVDAHASQCGIINR